ncbi:MAG: ADP-glyceromanno-heptose 6-epimerase [Chlamydiae bacterium]|nr:ADP-glyceromanno-heptose 6-epimerase [Chlamydiota bacterium]
MKSLYKDQFILVTGALGFIGSCVVRHFNNKGYKNLVLVDDFDAAGKWKNLRQKGFIECISSRELKGWLEGRESDLEGILHLGATSDTTELSGAHFYENNYRFSIMLAEFALKNSIPFIAASSAATYGDGLRGFSDDHEGLIGLMPMNIYGFSKHMFDLWALQQNVLDQIVCLKYFNVFGPNEYHKGKMASMVYHGYNQIKEKGYVELFKSTSSAYKDGEQMRDFIYVKDVVEMTVEFLTNGLKGVYNIGTSKPVSWNQLMHSIFKAMKMDPKIHYVDMPESLKKSYQNYTAADMTKYHAARKKEGLKPWQFTPIEKSVEDYVCNYLDKRDPTGDYSRW